MTVKQLIENLEAQVLRDPQLLEAEVVIPMLDQKPKPEKPYEGLDYMRTYSATVGHSSEQSYLLIWPIGTLERKDKV